MQRPTHRPARLSLAPLALTVRLAIAGAATLTLPLPAAAQPSTQASATDPAFDAAFQRFMQANGGDQSAIEPAAEAFAALAASHPGDPVLLAYAGAATAQRATTTMLPWKKMQYADDGLDRIDKALALLGPANDAPAQMGTPGVLTARFTAASTFLALPAMFHRHQRGQQLMAQVLASPLLAAAPLPFRGAVWLRAGKAAQDDGHADEARRLWQLAIDQHVPQAAAVRQHLQELAR